MDESPKFLEVLGRYGTEEQKAHLKHGGGTMAGQNADISPRGRLVDMTCKCGDKFRIETPPIS